MKESVSSIQEPELCIAIPDAILDRDRSLTETSALSCFWVIADVLDSLHG
jgi:hypothetical protein